MAFVPVIAQTPKGMPSQKTMDSLKAVALSQYAKRYPSMRQGSFSRDVIGKGTVKAELNGKALYEGEMRTTRTRANFNVPLAVWGRNVVSGTVNYQRVRFETEGIKSSDPQFEAIDRSTTKSTLGFSASFGGADSIFSIPLAYSASISGVTDQFSSIKRVNYLATLIFPLKRNQYSALSLGLVLVLDPSAVAPAIPIISYWHKYKTSDLELFVDLPSRISLRKQWSERSWTSIGTELGGNLFFFDLNHASVPQDAAYSSAELRTGATFEYLLTKKLIFGMNGGLYSSISPRMFKRNDKPTEYFLKTKNASVPYLSFSISFLPFLNLTK